MPVRVLSFVVAVLLPSLDPFAVLSVGLLAADLARGAESPLTRTVSLFTGPDFSGWQPTGKGAIGDWSMEDGCLVCHGRGHTWLRSSAPVGDFHLHLEYELTAGANSGVYVHVPANANHHRDSDSQPPAGFEVQIIDDHAFRKVPLKDYQFGASVYDISGAKPRNTKPPGSWNTLDIDCVGHDVAVTHNGVVVVDATADRFPQLRLRNAKGYLGLQSHNGKVRFRNVTLGPAQHGRTTTPRVPPDSAQR